MANAEAEGNSAAEWRYCFTEDKKATAQLESFLLGLSRHVNSLEDTTHDGLTPGKLAAFYRVIGGAYDTLFLETPAASLSLIYRYLGCAHSLVQAGDDGFAPPSVPALSPAGFVRWWTVQTLLDPAENAAYLKSAAGKYSVLDPVSGKPFPKDIPQNVFPNLPDEPTVRWHDTVFGNLHPDASDGSTGPGFGAGMASPPRRGSAPHVRGSSQGEARKPLFGEYPPGPTPPSPKSPPFSDRWDIRRAYRTVWPRRGGAGPSGPTPPSKGRPPSMDVHVHLSSDESDPPSPRSRSTRGPSRSPSRHRSRSRSAAAGTRSRRSRHTTSPSSSSSSSPDSRRRRYKKGSGPTRPHVHGRHTVPHIELPPPSPSGAIPLVSDPARPLYPPRRHSDVPPRGGSDSRPASYAAPSPRNAYYPGNIPSVQPQFAPPGTPGGAQRRQSRSISPARRYVVRPRDKEEEDQLAYRQRSKSTASMAGMQGVQGMNPDRLVPVVGVNGRRYPSERR